MDGNVKCYYDEDIFLFSFLSTVNKKLLWVHSYTTCVIDLERERERGLLVLILSQVYNI